MQQKEGFVMVFSSETRRNEPGDQGMNPESWNGQGKARLVVQTEFRCFSVFVLTADGQVGMSAREGSTKTETLPVEVTVSVASVSVILLTVCRDGYTRKVVQLFWFFTPPRFWGSFSGKLNGLVISSRRR